MGDKESLLPDMVSAIKELFSGTLGILSGTIVQQDEYVYVVLRP
jgi:hypothetical protein